VLGFAAAYRPCAFEQASERGHGVAVERNGPVPGGGLAAADGRDSAESSEASSHRSRKIHVITGGSISQIPGTWQPVLIPTLCQFDAIAPLPKPAHDLIEPAAEKSCVVRWPSVDRKIRVSLNASVYKS